MTSLNPMLTIGDADRRAAAAASRPVRSRRPGERAVELLERGRHPRARRSALDDYPHQLLRRHAPARDDRDGARLRAEAADRRRADDRARRHRAGRRSSTCCTSSSSEHGMALVLITHDMGVIAEMADEVVVMYAGQVVEQAPTAALFAAPEHPYTEALLGALPQLDGRPDGARGCRRSPAGRRACSIPPLAAASPAGARTPRSTTAAPRRCRSSGSSARLTGYGRRTPAASGCAGRRSCERGTA